jgi:hypothetical protein
MKCTLEKRLARVASNFGISFLTPLIGINLGNAIFQDHTVFIITILQAFLASSIYTGLSVCREVGDWSKK